MENILKSIEQIIKEKEYAILVEADDKYAYTSKIYLLAPMVEEDKPNIVGTHVGNLTSAFSRFAPGEHSDFTNIPEVVDFEKQLGEFIFLKNIRIFSEDGKAITIEAIQALHPRINKPDGTVLKEIKADSLQAALAELAKFMTQHNAQERENVEKRNKIYE